MFIFLIAIPKQFSTELTINSKTRGSVHVVLYSRLSNNSIATHTICQNVINISFFLVVLRTTLPFRTVVSLVEDSSKLRDVFFVQENNN